MGIQPFVLMALTIDANSVAAADFDGFVEVEINSRLIDELNVDEDDLAVKATVYNATTGLEVVAPFALTHTKGTGGRRWHGTVTIPQAAGAGTYILAVSQTKDIDLPSAAARRLKAEELEADDMDPIVRAFRYLA